MSAHVPGGTDDELMSEINVTPLVDVFLVLLVIFMVTAPLLGTALEVEVPEVTTAEPASRPVLVIEVDAAGSLAVDGEVLLLDEAVRRAREAAGPKGSGVFLRADRSVPYGFVMSVLDALRRSGIEAPSLVVEPVPGVVEGPPGAP